MQLAQKLELFQSVSVNSDGNSSANSSGKPGQASTSGVRYRGSSGSAANPITGSGNAVKRNHVRFVRSFTDGEKKALLAECSAVVYTPSFEHFGIVVCIYVMMTLVQLSVLPAWSVSC